MVDEVPVLVDDDVPVPGDEALVVDNVLVVDEVPVLMVDEVPVHALDETQVLDTSYDVEPTSFRSQELDDENLEPTRIARYVMYENMSDYMAQTHRIHEFKHILYIYLMCLEIDF